jgi:hypothetical protein
MDDYGMINLDDFADNNDDVGFRKFWTLVTITWPLEYRSWSNSAILCMYFSRQIISISVFTFAVGIYLGVLQAIKTLFKGNNWRVEYICSIRFIKNVCNKRFSKVFTKIRKTHNNVVLVLITVSSQKEKKSLLLLRLNILFETNKNSDE